MTASTRVYDVTLTTVDATHATTAVALTTIPGEITRVNFYRSASAGGAAEVHARFFRDAAKTKLICTFDLTASTSPVMPADTEHAAIDYENCPFQACYMTAATDAGTITGNLQITVQHPESPDILDKPSTLTITS